MGERSFILHYSQLTAWKQINIYELITVCAETRSTWMISETSNSRQIKLMGKHGIGNCIQPLRPIKAPKGQYSVLSPWNASELRALQLYCWATWFSPVLLHVSCKAESVPYMCSKPHMYILIFDSPLNFFATYIICVDAKTCYWWVSSRGSI